MATAVANRENYIGEKHNHIREGFGVYTYENRFFKYEGEWKNGKKDGHGKLIMADGSYYEGEFHNGEIAGHGFKYFALNGNTYSGEFHSGELQGQGVMNYSNGTAYEGQWSQNKRDGYGVLRKTDNSMYQGYHHQHKQHGEGTQIYSNGDRYDGDWVNDMRQGHGEFRQTDGTLYDGQWRNDRYNGQGTMVHSSGIVYEGLWINGFPSAMATKIVFKSLTSPHEVIQGQSFDAEVMLVNAEGEMVEQNGRELKITAGFKFTQAQEKASKPSSKETSSAGLFEVIEDIEEKPMETPFGYTVVSYPLTDAYNPDDMSMVGENSTAGISRSKTELSETPAENNQMVFGTDAQGGKSDEDKSSKDQDTLKSETEQSSTTGEETTSSNEPTSADLQASAPAALEGITMPPPVSNQKSKQGIANFENLVLPAAPPMYRPFLMADMDELRERGGGSRASQGSRQGRRTSRLVQEDKSPASRSKKLGDEKYSRPAGDERLGPPVPYSPEGEYVIMVEDVTSPPFMGVALETAFLQIKITLPKKTKRRATGTSIKPAGPKWDTSQHITKEISKTMTNLAEEEYAKAFSSLAE